MNCKYAKLSKNVINVVLVFGLQLNENTHYVYP